MNLFKNTIMKLRLAILAVILLSGYGCGGGGGGDGGGGSAAPSSNSSNPTIASGVASKGLLNGSKVCAYAISSGSMGAQIGNCTTTDAAGQYTINLGTYSGPVLLQATGGTYIDEATGATVSLASPLDSMLLNATAGNISVAITALTELAFQNASGSAGGLTSANIQSAIASVQNNFGVADIVNTMPVDALNVPASATAAQKTYALALATISQYQNGRPAGTSLPNALQPMLACLVAPTTGCGAGTTSVGTLLNAALGAFQAGHPAFSGLTLPVNAFGSSNTSNGTITLQTVKQLNSATVGSAFSQNVVSSIVPQSPPAMYTYLIDTLANGVTPTGMTLNMNGVLSGTPFATGATDVNGYQVAHTYNFGVCATDTLSRITTLPCPQTSITVLPLNITVTLAGTGTGTVTPSPAGNSCGANCYSGFASASSVTLTATPATGSAFTGWSGACSGTDASCVLTMNTSKTVTATFDQTKDTTSAGSSATLIFTSASCTAAPKPATFGDLITYTATASGPVGSSLFDYSYEVLGGPASYGRPTSCGTWTYDAPNLRCIRASANPATTDITVTTYSYYYSLNTISIAIWPPTSGVSYIKTSVTCPLNP